MGNLCGKQSKEDNFQGPGRTLGSARPPSDNARASIPAKVKAGGSAKPAPKVGGPSRTLGGGENAGSAQSAAAAAAEARNNKAPTGDLAKKLAEQKKQTHNQALQAAAAENRAQREADAATEARNYN